MNSEDLKSIQRKKYADIAKNSLIKVQYSCSGNSCDFEADDEDEEIVDENSTIESDLEKE